MLLMAAALAVAGRLAAATAPPGPPPLDSDPDAVRAGEVEPSETATPSGAHRPVAASADPAPAPLPKPSPLRLTLPDYNAPDPKRNGYNWARSVASVSTANYLVWQFNWFVEEDWAYVTRDGLRNNFERGFKFDGNKLPTNFFAHPYHGSVYFSLGRASGLSFWESTSMAFLGSLSWELTGETEAPSTNDLVATTLGGIALGEMLYRLSSEVLDDSSFGMERVLREVFAGLINPGRGIQRLLDGKAWDMGPPAAHRNVVHMAVAVGVDRVRLLHDRSIDAYEPRPLLAVRVEYGDFIPRGKSNTLGPFEAFDFFSAFNFGRLEELGAQIYAQGMLVGVSTPIGSEEGLYRDNNVFGLVQSFDFRGAQVAKFGGMGIGPGDVLVLRYGPEQQLRLGVDLQWLVLGASSSPRDGGLDTGYNYLTGITTAQELRLQMGVAGELGLRAKQYAAFVIAGEPGEEFIGHTRAWYELDVIDSIGLGLSPNLVHRISRFDTTGPIWSAQLETQVYLRGHF